MRLEVSNKNSAADNYTINNFWQEKGICLLYDIKRGCVGFDTPPILISYKNIYQFIDN